MIVKKIFLVVSLLPSTGALGRHHSLFSREALGLKNNNDPNPEINECSTNADCPTGSFCDTTGTNGNICEDIDECALGTDDCDVNADCADTNGSFICTCKTGYTGDGKTCSPVINECLIDTDCLTGFFCDKTGTNGNTCENIDECALGTDDCHVNADCADTNGSFICTCKTGYTGDGKTCAPLPCLSAPCKNGGACEDVVGGGYNCECTEYWEGDTCEVDVNECEIGDGANINCLQKGARLCHNLPGDPGYDCCYNVLTPPVSGCVPK